MNNDLRRLVHDRLNSEDLLSKNRSSLVLAACDGRDALDGVLQNAKTTAKADEKATATTHAGAYLTVEGFRGIGPRQTLTLTPRPGLTIVVGRNGSMRSDGAARRRRRRRAPTDGAHRPGHGRTLATRYCLTRTPGSRGCARRFLEGPRAWVGAVLHEGAVTVPAALPG